ncbi:DUF4331 family protein, partial [Streptomyces cavernicola]
EVKIDLTGDSREDATFRVTFGDHDRRGRQKATLRLLTGPDARDRDAEGTVITTTTSGKRCSGKGDIRFWAGAARDPFYVEPTVVTAVRTSITEGCALDLTGFDPAEPKNLFDGTTVQAIVIEVPDCFFTGLSIGVWGSTAVATDVGDGWRQIDRAGIPLVSTLFGLHEADTYANAHPAADAPVFGAAIRAKIEGAVKANGTCEDPDGYAAKVSGQLLPDVLPYRVGSQAQFTGGQRNGRALTENVAEEIFRLVLHKHIATGLDEHSCESSRNFPYLAEK